MLETAHYTFVHGGLPEGDPSGWDAWQCMKYDHFMTTPRRFDKWVIVGHWPVMLYHENIVDANPVFDDEKKIISIDGGCVLKDDGQLNALLIPRDGSTDFSCSAYDPFPAARVARQAASAQLLHPLGRTPPWSPAARRGIHAHPHRAPATRLRLTK